MKKAVQYGAGNIGRGFLGQLFFQSAYEVTFIDVNQELVHQLNRDGRYPIRIVSDKGGHEIEVENVKAIEGRDLTAIAKEIASADIMATAVGVHVLPRIVKPIALGLKKRWQENNMQPFNVILCENLLDAASYLGELIKKELDEEEIVLFQELVGLVEASIGRMVPVMTPEMQEGNILRVCVEEYCRLPVDQAAFKGEIPEIVHMVPFTPFAFYIQRKLFIHNLGHAITAYLGAIKGYRTVWEAIRDPYIQLMVFGAMEESAAALAKEHQMDRSILSEHIDDLLVRFGNRQLGDTIERVGKDPIRKLSPRDRLLGACTLCSKHGIVPSFISLGIAAAMNFQSEGDDASKTLADMLKKEGPETVLREICGLNEQQPLWRIILKFYGRIRTPAPETTSLHPFAAS